MIRYHESIATRINFNDNDNYSYRSLLMKDYRYIRDHIGVERIEKSNSNL